MNIPEIYTEIIDELIRRSSLGTAKWSSTGRTDAFLIQFANFGLVVNHWEDNNGESMIVRLMDTNGQQIDMFEVYTGEDDYGKLNGLHALARRNALNIDKAILEIKSELRSNKEVGKVVVPAKTESSPDDIPF